MGRLEIHQKVQVWEIRIPQTRALEVIIHEWTVSPTHAIIRRKEVQSLVLELILNPDKQVRDKWPHVTTNQEHEAMIMVALDPVVLVAALTAGDQQTQVQPDLQAAAGLEDNIKILYNYRKWSKIL